MEDAAGRPVISRRFGIFLGKDPSNTSCIKRRDGKKIMNPIEISCPSKTFILGEYGVLAGGPAVLINTRPRFQCGFRKKSKKSAPDPFFFHKKSPASRWAESHKKDFQGLSLKWDDPFEGRGGMGFSSAQFNILYGYSLLQQGLSLDQISPQKLWRVYREMEFEGWTPSGADVVSQWVGGVCLFQQNPLRIRSLTLPLPSIECLIVRTGQRLNTYEHLRNLQIGNVSVLKSLAHEGLKAMESGEEKDFLRIVNEYGKALARLGFVTNKTLRILKELQRLKEVKAMKGCGAMGAEVVIIFYKKKHEIFLRKKLSGFEILTDSSQITYGLEIHKPGE